jgi:hypothetical protein
MPATTRSGALRRALCILALAALVPVGLQGCFGGNSGDTPPASTWGISGRVTFGGTGLQGVTLTLAGASSAIATSDSDGSYRFAGLTNG